MHKFFIALFLLSVPVSTNALARSSTDQEEKACAPDVKRFCRKLMDQGDFAILACLKENRPKLSSASMCVPKGAWRIARSRLIKGANAGVVQWQNGSFPI